MALPLPYGGCDIDQVERDCVLSLRQHSATEPLEDLSAFNPRVKQYGDVWSEVVDKIGGVYVVAGVSGNMTGVPVAFFKTQNRDSAKRYASDFESGKVFTIQNDERWCDYVAAAHDAKSLDSDVRQFLVSRGRKSGMTLDGKTYDQAGLLAAYESGELF